MKNIQTFNTIAKRFKKHAYSYTKENKKLIIQFILSFFFFAIGIWFLKHERTELNQVKYVLFSSKWQWMIAGLVLTLAYILLQAQMYVYSFLAIRKKISFKDSYVLFIKRNFISVFLPAGGISSLGFYTAKIEESGIKKSQIHFASSIYGFTGILSVVIVAIPVFL